jgi:hypothetical protein
MALEIIVRVLSSKAIGAGVIPDIRAVAAISSKLDVVDVGRLAVLENKHLFVAGPIHRTHAAVRFHPNADIDELEVVVEAAARMSCVCRQSMQP